MEIDHGAVELPGCLTFVNAAPGMGRPTAVRVLGPRIASVNCEPEAGDLVIDLQGDRILPGLINAHDHLQLNSLPKIEAGGFYRDARDWIADVTAHRQLDPSFEAQVAVPRNDRLLIGGIKNLLSGVTTVAHHDPLYGFLCSDVFPTRIVTDCGWSHSLYLEGEAKVRDVHARTPRDWPWIIHVAEGINAAAAREFDQLEALGCVAPNTLIVHGVALDRARRIRLLDAGAGLIWCPSSNLRLFGRTATIDELVEHRRVALGTDSRLTGARDLLAELRIAREIAGFDDAVLEALVTRDAAALLRLPDRGILKVGARADLVILPADMPLSAATRADLRLVLLDGIPRYAHSDYAERLACARYWAEVRVDGKPMRLEYGLAAALAEAAAREPDLELPSPPSACRGEA